MLFNSYEFIFLFLPITFVIYFWLNKKRLTQASKAWMVFSSLFFYSWWNAIYLPIILGSILFNFAVGSTITHINGTQSFEKTDFFQNDVDLWDYCQCPFVGLF